MDFVLSDRLLTLVIDDGAFAGVEATVRIPKNVGPYWARRRLMRPRDEGETDEEYEARLHELYAFVADTVVSWNVADHNGPVPLTRDAIERVDVELIAELLYLWSTATEQSPFVRPSLDSAPTDRRPTTEARKRRSPKRPSTATS